MVIFRVLYKEGKEVFEIHSNTTFNEPLLLLYMEVVGIGINIGMSFELAGILYSTHIQCNSS